MVSRFACALQWRAALRRSLLHFRRGCVVWPQDSTLPGIRQLGVEPGPATFRDSPALLVKGIVPALFAVIGGCSLFRSALRRKS